MLVQKNTCLELLQNAFQSNTDNIVKTDLQYELAEYSIYNGYMEESIKHFNYVINAPRSNNSHSTKVMLLNLAIAQLHQGKITPCLNDDNVTTCKSPLTENNLPDNTHDTHSAIKTLTSMLATEPDHPLWRWLLNLSYMTLGEYPASVPKKYLIPPEKFQSSESFPKFDNIADSLGFTREGLAGGAIMDDFNNDGNIDIVMSSSGYCDPVRIFMNNGIDGFKETTIGSGLDNQLGASHMIQADYDNDGLLDIYITRGLWENPYQPREFEYNVDVYNSLLRNTGNGHFEDVTDKTGLRAAGPNYNISSVWSDFNNDGFVDLFVCNNMKKPLLFLNQQGQSFIQPVLDTGLENNNMCMGVSAGDIDNDGFVDIFLSSVDAKSQLFINKSIVKPTNNISAYLKSVDKNFLDWFNNTFSSFSNIDDPSVNTANVQFESLTEFKSLMPEGGAFASMLSDFNNDGLLDIFVGGFQGSIEYKDTGRIMAGNKIQQGNSILLTNDGSRKFKMNNAGPENAIMVMGANTGDFNNDGYEDLLLGTGAPALENLMPNRGYLNKNGNKFVDITYSGGFGNLQKGHGISFADLDNDGDQDIIAMFGGFYPGDISSPSIYSNPGFANHWITLRLEGVKSNRSAIGTKIILEIEENGKSRRIYRMVSSGGSFGSNSLQVEAGLGKATLINKLTVEWAGSGTKNIYEHLPSDNILKIREGDLDYSIIQQASIHFKTNPDAALYQHKENPFLKTAK